jgi:uncharacterized membrane protein YtjA (UPF0391 family)
MARRLLHSTCLNRQQETNMLAWTLTFRIIAIIAAALGFTGVAGAAASVAQFIFVLFLVLFVASLIFGFVRRPGAR